MPLVKDYFLGLSEWGKVILWLDNCRTHRGLLESEVLFYKGLFHYVGYRTRLNFDIKGKLQFLILLLF